MKTDKQTKVIAAPQAVAAVPAAVAAEIVQPAAAPSQENTRQEQEETLDGNIVKSPLVGTFYNAPSPDAEPYVRWETQSKKVRSWRLWKL